MCFQETLKLEEIFKKQQHLFMAAFGVSKLLKREQDKSPLENYPRKIAPYTIASRTIAPPRQSYPGQWPPRKIAPRTIPT